MDELFSRAETELAALGWRVLDGDLGALPGLLDKLRDDGRVEAVSAVSFLAADLVRSSRQVADMTPGESRERTRRRVWQAFGRGVRGILAPDLYQIAPAVAGAAAVLDVATIPTGEQLRARRQDLARRRREVLEREGLLSEAERDSAARVRRGDVYATTGDDEDGDGEDDIPF